MTPAALDSDNFQPDPAEAAERAARQLAGLKELGEIGLELARSVRRQALEAEGAAPSETSAQTTTQPTPRAEFGLVFARIARAVRQTYALETQIAEETAGKAAIRRSEQVRRDAVRHAAGARRKADVMEIVSEAIEIEAEETDRPERVAPLQTALFERMNDRDDLAEDYADRPIGEMVALICKDLGVTMDWAMWDTAPWAMEESRMRPSGSPYANGPPEPIWPYRPEDEAVDDEDPDPPSCVTPEGGEAACPGPIRVESSG